MTKISVLMTNYNYEQYVEEAVESVMAQTVLPDEIVLVDDGSTDSSREIIEKLARRYPKTLKVLLSENGGQAAALNRAYAESTGDRIFLMDSDDTWVPEKLETMLPYLDECGFVQHNLSLQGRPYRSFLVQAEHLHYMQQFGFADFFTPTSALCFRRDVLDQIFPLPYADTLPICADALITRLALHYSPLQTVDRQLGLYRVHGDNCWYTERFRGQEYMGHVFDTLNKVLEDRGFPRLPFERNCHIARPQGEPVQDVAKTLEKLREMGQDPLHAVPCLVLEGYLLLSQEQAEEALEAFGRAVEMGSSVPEDVTMLLQLAEDGKDTSLPQAPLSLELSADTFFQMAVCLVRLRRYEQALEAFASVLQYAPDRLEIHLNRSDSLRYLGRFDEALAEVDLAEEKNSDLPGLAETREKVYRAMRSAGVPTPAEIRGYNVQIQTTSICNGKCVMCPYLDSWHRDNPGTMSDEVFTRILQQLKTVRVDKICMYLENEPLVDPKLVARMEQVVREIPFKLMEISTNASLLTEELAGNLARVMGKVPHQIWISFHGMDKRTYEGIMGLDFERSLERVINLLRIAEENSLNVIIRGSGEPQRNELRHEFSFSEEEYRAFWKDQFAKQGIINRPKINYFRYHDRCGTIRRNSLRLSENVRDDLTGFYCPRVDSWLHFLYTGELCICCMDYHREQVFGDINTHTLEEIFSSSAYTNLRDMAFGVVPSPPDFICKRCISPNG